MHSTKSFVIMTGANASGSEALAESKAPYPIPVDAFVPASAGKEASPLLTFLAPIHYIQKPAS